MRLTLLVRADKSGLGYQTQAYYKHLKPHKTVIIDISLLNGNQQHYDWYQDAHVIRGLPTDDDLVNILHDTDVLLTAETPYNPKLYTLAREKGIKTVCVENPEFFDQFRYPDYPLPDVIILPSIWKQQEIRDYAEPQGTKVVQLHHPVDLDDFRFRQRQTTKFLHIAGKPAAHDRNGTWDFMQACPDGVVVTQSDDLAWQLRRRFSRCDVFTNVQDAEYMYSLGDVMVLPRKYGGNCLPLNEALATGMPVIMTDIEPNNNILPKEWLVPATKVDSFTPRGNVDIYQVNHQLLAEKLEWFRLQNTAEHSDKAYEIAQSISWQTLLPKYQELLESL